MKKLILIVCCLVSMYTTKAQQVAQQSQYMYNKFSINPAYAGAENGIPISLNFRRQWVGIEDAPITQTLSAHAFTGKFVGMGISFFNDVTGPTRRTGMNLSFARHLQLDDREEKWLSFGLAGTIHSFSFDQSKLTLDDPNDPAITGSFYNEFSPDINFGVYYSTADYYAGFSVSNILQSKTDLFNLDANHGNQIVRTYFLTAGYKFILSEDFAFEPSFLVKYTGANSSQVDINGKLDIKNRFWGGASYRLKDAIVAFVGINLDLFELVYSYDYITSDINRYSGGSHEISLTARLQSPLSRNDDNTFGKKRPKSKSRGFATKKKRRRK